MSDHDDEGSGNEFLEGEKRRDPIEFAQKYMAKLEELMGEGGILSKTPQRPGTPATFIGPAMPVEVHMAISQIKNGWLVSVQGSPAFSSRAESQYVQHQKDVPGVVTGLLTAALGPDPTISDFRTPPPEGK